MKTSHDPRHLIRIKVVKELFARNFNSTTNLENSLSLKITENLEGIDQEISKTAPERPLKQINPIDLTILRLAIYELLNEKVPYKVIVDEAVEIAKDFGGDSSPGFINGVLGKVIANHRLDKQ